MINWQFYVPKKKNLLNLKGGKSCYTVNLLFNWTYLAQNVLNHKFLNWSKALPIYINQCFGWISVLSKTYLYKQGFHIIINWYFFKNEKEKQNLYVYARLRISYIKYYEYKV